jgi:hypothetical protein
VPRKLEPTSPPDLILPVANVLRAIEPSETFLAPVLCPTCGVVDCDDFIHYPWGSSLDSGHAAFNFDPSYIATFDFAMNSFEMLELGDDEYAGLAASHLSIYRATGRKSVSVINIEVESQGIVVVEDSTSSASAEIADTEYMLADISITIDDKKGKGEQQKNHDGSCTGMVV